MCNMCKMWGNEKNIRWWAQSLQWHCHVKRWDEKEQREKWKLNEIENLCLVAILFSSSFWCKRKRRSFSEHLKYIWKASREIEKKKRGEKKRIRKKNSGAFNLNPEMKYRHLRFPFFFAVCSIFFILFWAQTQLSRVDDVFFSVFVALFVCRLIFLFGFCSIYIYNIFIALASLRSFVRSFVPYSSFYLPNLHNYFCRCIHSVFVSYFNIFLSLSLLRSLRCSLFTYVHTDGPIVSARTCTRTRALFKRILDRSLLFIHSLYMKLKRKWKFSSSFDLKTLKVNKECGNGNDNDNENEGDEVGWWRQQRLCESVVGIMA